jgi:type II secretory pathway pseudopilin PulG
MPGWAVALIICGCSVPIIAILAAMLLPALAAAKAKAQEINCINNEKQLDLAVRIYAGDHNNQMPPAATWCDAIQTYVGSEKPFKCPAANATSRCDYAFNAKLDGLNQNSINPETVVIFESDAGWNASGGSEMLAIRHHHHGGIFVVAFADGSVHAETESQLATLRWDP